MPHHAQFYHPYQIKIHPTKLFPSPSRADGLFELSIRYGATDDWQMYSLVHIPPSVQYAFSEGRVQAFHLEYLPLNGAASWALPGSPQYVVLGVELADGSRVACVSPELHVAFKKKMFVAACLLIGGGLLALTPGAWIGGLMFGYGIFRAGLAAKIPRKSHWSAKLSS